MATKTQRRTKWLHNRSFVSTIGDEFPDWMVVVLFYVALQAVETLFAHDKTRVHRNHEERNQTLKTIRRYRKIWTHYRPLYDAGRTARYEVNATSWIPLNDVKERLVKDLYALEASVVQLTRSNEKLEPIW